MQCGRIRLSASVGRTSSKSLGDGVVFDTPCFIVDKASNSLHSL